MSTIEEAIAFGQQKLHIEAFRDNQREVIEHYLQGKDVLFCSPTGTGKSLTFETAPFVFKKMTAANYVTVVVISPLVALMTKQTEKCGSIGLKSVYLRGEQDTIHTGEDELVEEMDKASLYDIHSGEVDIIFASPETILTQQRQVIHDLTKKGYLKAIFIDEAHCIRKYGKIKPGEKRRKAFRPEYGRLGELRALAPGIPVIALTATATHCTRDTIIQELCMKRIQQIIISPNKLNIKYWQIETSGIISHDFTWLVRLLREQGANAPRIVIFFRKIKQLGNVFDFLRSQLKEKAFVKTQEYETYSYNNRLFDMFHNKTSVEVKQLVCQSFMKLRSIKRVVLCSTSFSMGLDLQGVDTVVHYGPANDVEDYIQETGRAGRDPNTASNAVLMKFKNCLSGKRNITDEMKTYVKTKRCRRVELLKLFEHNPEPLKPLHMCCDNCAVLCKCLCHCHSTCSCDRLCIATECTVVQLYKSSCESSSESDGPDDEDYETSSDSDIASNVCLKHVKLSYSSEED